MKKMLFAAVLAACVNASALAADAATAAPAKPLTAQQQKMKDCNAEAKAKALKGADRKAFMKTCLSKEGTPAAAAAAAAAPAAAAPAAAAAAAAAESPKAAQQQKMKDCSAEAKSKGLKGKDRKSFMSTCLSGSTSGAAK